MGEKKIKMKNQSKALMDRLEKNTDEETFLVENQNFEAHQLIVVNVENCRKEGKILRDIDDLSQLKKQICHISKKKVQTI